MTLSDSSCHPILTPFANEAMRLLRLAVPLAAIVAVACVAALPRTSAQVQDASRLSVTHEDARTFRIVRPDAPALRVTFLTETAFRVHVLTDDETARPIDYMRVRTDASYPPVAVQVETTRDGLRFSTSAVALRLVTRERSVS